MKTIFGGFVLIVLAMVYGQTVNDSNKPAQPAMTYETMLKQAELKAANYVKSEPVIVRMGIHHGYEYIKPGMTLPQVQTILDNTGRETTSSSTAQVWRWEADNYTIAATFVDGRLASKSQAGY